MRRSIAFSAKQKREQLQDKRAVKRGELDPTEVRYARNPLGNYRPGANHLPNPSLGPVLANRLQSQFIALTPDYLQQTRDLAHSKKLSRPLKDDVAVFPIEWMERDGGKLTCPLRPAYKAGQTKEEVEKNEEEVFRQWMRDTRGFVEQWVDEEPGQEGDDIEQEGEGSEGPRSGQELRSPTWFETNLEVWRQLWRVTESSHILLLLADARCPALHLPTSLRTYVQSLRPLKEVILILTKSDLVETKALEGWRVWAKHWWTEGQISESKQDVQVITIQSFDDLSDQRRGLSSSSHQQLIEALQIAHERLLNRSNLSTDVDQLSKTRLPPADIGWNQLSKEPASTHYPSDPPSPGSTSTYPLTIGLIGQPNVGKSSLLNAILGRTKVKAGKTPGKTKHLQTIFWGDKKEVKFVDCPGLVCPSLVGLEIQALCGILPISRIPSLPACILAASQLLPLETIFNISSPSDHSPRDEYADKRTWRTPRVATQSTRESEPEKEWTAWKIMEGRALHKVTAKTGRPDIMRAATGMMLALAEGSIRWCFYPPGSSPKRGGQGIWLSDSLSGNDSGDDGCAKQSSEGDKGDSALDKDFFDSVRLGGVADRGVGGL